MVLALFILGAILIGWFAPRPIVARLPGATGMAAGIGAALVLGALFIWLGAQAAGALGVEPAQSAFERGLNAWKIMLLVAPAAALHARRAAAKPAEE